VQTYAVDMSQCGPMVLDVLNKVRRGDMQIRRALAAGLIHQAD